MLNIQQITPLSEWAAQVKEELDYVRTNLQKSTQAIIDRSEGITETELLTLSCYGYLSTALSIAYEELHEAVVLATLSLSLNEKNDELRKVKSKLDGSVQVAALAFQSTASVLLCRSQEGNDHRRHSLQLFYELLRAEAPLGAAVEKLR